MKKLDVLMLKSFSGPFVLTTGVATFILLIQYLLKYFDDFVGKNLGFSVFAELLFYFSLNMMQNSLPLGVLVASLMTFGNLGESFELTAIKGSGISLLRVLRPVFIFVCFLSIGAFFFNNYTIPAANLKAYSLLYDIKHTKPALDIKEGAFYNGIPDYSIKVKEKFPDGKTLKDVIIYDHTDGRGNKSVIMADSSLMYTIMEDRYLKLELYEGHYYSEREESGKQIDQFSRTQFKRMDLVFSLSSFDLKRRKEELFQNNRQMKTIRELSADIDSFQNEIHSKKAEFIQNSRRYYTYHLNGKSLIVEEAKIKTNNPAADSTKAVGGRIIEEAGLFPLNLLQYQKLKRSKEPILRIPKDSIGNGTKLSKPETFLSNKVVKPDSLVKIKAKTNIGSGLNLGEIDLDTLGWAHLDEILETQRKPSKTVFTNALNNARNIKVNLSSVENSVYRLKKEYSLYTIEHDRKYALALACVLMFMIGAPLGAIIKKGGLGVPVIIAVFFFIVYYVIGMIGNQQAKEGQMNPYVAVWMSDVVLLPFGLYFLRQARIDARLFDVDAYIIWFEKLLNRFAGKSK